MKKKQDANTAANSTSPPNKAKKKKEATKSREWERDRRERLNNSFTDLSKLLPIEGSNAPPTKKIEILQKAFAYIKTLQQENAELLESGGLEKAWSREVKQLQCQVKELTSRIQQLARLVQDAGGKLPAWVALPANQPIPPPLGKRQFLYSNRITQEELTDKSVHEKVLEPKQKKARKAAPKKKEANTSKKKRPRAAKKSESVASNANKDSAIKPPTVAQLLNVPSSSTSSVAGTSGIVLLPPEKPASIDMPPGILVLKGSSSQPAASTNSNLSSAGLLIVRTPASQSSSLAPGTCILLPSSSSQTPPTQQSPAQTTSLLTTPIMATGQPPSSSTATPTFVLTNGSLVPVLSSQNSAKQSLPLAAKPAQENKNSNKIAIPKLPKRNVKSTKSPAKKKKAIIEAVVNLEPIKSIVVSSGSEIIDAPKDVPLPKSPEKQEEESKEEASKSESPAVKASESSGKHKSSYSIDALCQGKQTPTDSEEASTEALAAAESSKGEEKVEKSSDKPAEQVAEPKEVAYPSEKPQETPLAYTESMSVCNNYSGHEFVPAEISPSGFIGPQPPMATVVDAPSKEALDTYPDSYRAEHRSSPEVIPSSFSSDLFASLNVPSGHPESISPTAAFLLAFPLVSSSTGRTNEAEQPDRVDNTGGNSLLQLGSMDEPSSVVELNSLMQQGPRHHELVAVSKMSQGPREAKQYCFPLNEPVADYDAEISSIMSHTPTNKQSQPRLANNFSRPKPHKDNCVREPYTASDKQFVPLPVQNSPTLYPSAHAMQQPMYACSKKQLPVQQAPYQQNPAAHYPMQNSPRCNIVNYNQPIFSTSVASSNIQSQKPIPSNPPRSDVCSQKPSTEQSYNQPIFSTSTASSNIQSQKPSNSPKQSADQRDGYNNPMFSTSTASSNIQSQKPSNSQVQSTEQREGYHQPIFSTSAASSNIQSQKPSISQVQSTEQREGNHPIFSTSTASSNIQSQKPSNSQVQSTEQREGYNHPIFSTSAACSNIQSQKPSNSPKQPTEQRKGYNHSIFSTSVASANIQSQKPSNSPKQPTEQKEGYHQPIFSTSAASSNIQSQKLSNSPKQPTEQREGYHQPIFSTSTASSNIQSQKPSNPPKQSADQRDSYNHPIFSTSAASSNIQSQKLSNSPKQLTEQREGYHQPIFSTSAASSNIQSQKPITRNPPRIDVCSQKPLTEQSYNQPIFTTSVANSSIQTQKPIPSNPPRSDVCSQKPLTEQSYNQAIFSTSVASSSIQSQKPSNSQKPLTEQSDGYSQPIFSTSVANSSIQSQKPSNSQKPLTEQSYNQPIFSTSVANSSIQTQKPIPSNPPRNDVCSQKPLMEQSYNQPIFSTSVASSSIQSQNPPKNDVCSQKPLMEQSYNQPIFSTSVANSNIQSQKPIPSNPPRNDVSSQKPLTEQSYNQPIFGSSVASSSIQSQKPSNSQKHSIEQRDSYSHSIFSASVASSNIQPQKPSNSPRTDVCSQKHPTEQRDTSHFIGKLNTNKPESNNSQKYKMSSPEGGKPQSKPVVNESRFDSQQRLNLVPTTTADQTYVSKPVVNESRFDSQQRLNLVPTTTADQTYVSKPVVNESRFDAQQRLNLVPTTTSSQAYACNIFNDYQSSNYLPLPPLSSVSSSATTDTATSSFGSFSVAHNSSNFGILSWSTLSPMSASNSQQQQVPSYSVDGQKQGYQHSGDNNRYQQRQISYPPPTKEAVPPTPRPPVNWMTDIPAQNSFEQAASYGSSYPDYADALNNTWQKSSSQANPLPTLVGDLALGPTPTTKYCYKAAAARKQPDKEKRGGDYCSSFLSVSQLVDHTTVKEPSRPPPPSRKSGRPASKASSRRDRSKNTQAFNETIASSAPTTYRPISNYPAPKPSYKATPSNYSAESLIAGIHPPPQQQDLILHDKSERYPQSYPPRSHFSGESTNYFPESLDPNYQQSSYPCSGNYQASGNNYMNQTTFPDTDLAASSSIPAPSFPPDFLFPVTTAASVTSRPSFFPGSDVKSSSRKRSRHLEQAEPGYQDYQLQDFNAGRSTQQVRCEATAAQNCAPTYRAAAGQVSTPPSNSVPGVASSSLTNFNLSTIFPDLNDKTPVPPLPAFVSSKNLGAGAPLLPGAGTDYMLHHSNMGFNNLLSHNAPHQVGMRLNQSFATPSFPNMMPPPSLPFSVHEH